MYSLCISLTFPWGIPGTRARLFSPPPPPALRGLTPEVPPLPQHFAQHRSRPHRHHHHHNTPGIHIPPVIRASEQPLPFEANMESLPRLPPRGTAPVAAPRSHHLPSMGFGGALLSLNRQHAAEAQVREERDARSGFNLPTLSDFLRHIQGVGSRFTTPFMSWAYNESEHHHHPPRQLSPLEDMDPWLDNFPSFGPMGDFRRRQLEREKPVHWKPEYTHPNPAGPGFSFDFASPDNTIPAPPGIIDLVNDGPGPSSSAASPSSSAVAATVETTLVCARCLDPLVLAAPDGASEDVRKRTRVWALRCGHMLDGKCVAELMLPPPPAPAPSDAPCSDGGSAAPLADKGKGKGRADAPAPTIDRKGKRKAEGPLEPESSPKRPALESAPEQEPASPSMPGALPPPPSPPVMGGDDSIRARLRSRNRGQGAPAEETSQALVERLLQPRPPRRSGARGGGTGKGKGKGKGKAPRGPAIEAEHEWACPVMGCGRLHWSVRVQGEWRNDEGRGGIALFV